MSKETPGVRYAEVERETQDTRIRVVLDLDGARRATVDTGIGALDHMLTQMSFHGRFDLGVSAEGDLEVDDHHTVEDIGICFGRAIRQALGDGEGINRFGFETIPMDDALARVAIDISGRPLLVCNVEFRNEKIGGLSTQNVSEFFKAVVNHAGLTVHMHLLEGRNDYHICEALFKAFGRALRKATAKVDSRGAPSFKGLID
jgi:imidazoleglycerol-phosphate dehydratase